SWAPQRLARSITAWVSPSTVSLTTLIDGRPSSDDTTPAAPAKPAPGRLGTMTLPVSVVGNVRATQRPAGPGSTATSAPAGRAAPRSAAALAGLSGTEPSA